MKAERLVDARRRVPTAALPHEPVVPAALGHAGILPRHRWETGAFPFGAFVTPRMGILTLFGFVFAVTSIRLLARRITLRSLSGDHPGAVGSRAGCRGTPVPRA